MSALLIILAMVTLAFGEDELKNKEDKLSYALGLNIGNSFKQQSIEIKPDIFLKGIKDAFAGGKQLLSDDEIRETMVVLNKELAEKKAEAMKKLAEKNKEDAVTFFAENKKKEGVKTLASGLQYKIITEGKGKSPKATDTVTVHYRGTLIDGKEFDSSYRRGEPATFPVNGVISGWTEALQLMKVGSKWQLFLPSDLAYGEKGAGNLIGPNAALIFEVELISVK
ncbi:MAG: FKBP-type peptidyl-prolyl cis-trans isomerase [Deltaproteobacteria bacterium]|nr:FKBP-type peptidyl-prolyl cis-trans isomerase [Deltaproteobacteria bacterium]